MSEPFVLDAAFATSVHHGLNNKRKARNKPPPLALSCLLTVFALPIALFTITLVAWGLIDDWVNRENWIETQATILNCEMSGGRSPSPDITHTFSVPNADQGLSEITITNLIPHSNCTYFITGQTILIEYLSRDPRRTHIIEPGFAETPLQHYTLYAAFLLPGLVMLGVATNGVVEIIRRFNYNTRFREESVMLMGEIVSCERKFVGEKRERCYVEVVYQFKYPETLHTGTVTVEREDLREKHLPVVGSPVMVAYIDAKHYRML